MVTIHQTQDPCFQNVKWHVMLEIRMNPRLRETHTLRGWQASWISYREDIPVGGAWSIPFFSPGKTACRMIMDHGLEMLRLWLSWVGRKMADLLWLVAIRCYDRWLWKSPNLSLNWGLFTAGKIIARNGWCSSTPRQSQGCGSGGIMAGSVSSEDYPSTYLDKSHDIIIFVSEILILIHIPF